MTYTAFLSGYFEYVWQFFQLHIPIVGLTVAQVLIGSTVVVLGIFIINSYLGFGVSSIQKNVVMSSSKIHKRYEAHKKQVAINKAKKAKALKEKK